MEEDVLLTFTIICDGAAFVVCQASHLYSRVVPFVLYPRLVHPAYLTATTVFGTPSQTHFPASHKLLQ